MPSSMHLSVCLQVERLLWSPESGLMVFGAIGKKPQHKNDVVEELRQKCHAGTVTLVYAARDEQHNGALVLKAFLKHHES